MLDGETIEEPFSILSASIEHPLQPGCSLEANRELPAWNTNSDDIRNTGRNYVMSAFNADAIEKVKRGLNPPGKEENRHARRRGGGIIRYDVITL